MGVRRASAEVEETLSTQKALRADQSQCYKH